MIRFLGVCTFEASNICGFTVTKGTTNPDFHWTRASGATTSIGTGPSNDHTYNSSIGTFLVLSAIWLLFDCSFVNFYTSTKWIPYNAKLVHYVQKLFPREIYLHLIFWKSSTITFSSLYIKNYFFVKMIKGSSFQSCFFIIFRSLHVCRSIWNCQKEFGSTNVFSLVLESSPVLCSILLSHVWYWCWQACCLHPRGKLCILQIWEDGKSK